MIEHNQPPVDLAFAESTTHVPDLETKTARLREALAARQQTTGDESMLAGRGDELIFDERGNGVITEYPGFYTAQSLSDEQIDNS